MVLPPDLEPRATAHMDSIIAMVQTLVDKGYAYRADNGDVYFAVDSFADYGALSGKKPDELLADAGVPGFIPMDQDHPVDDCVGLIIGGRECTVKTSRSDHGNG